MRAPTLVGEEHPEQEPDEGDDEEGREAGGQEAARHPHVALPARTSCTYFPI